jgi:hypothetical protein
MKAETYIFYNDPGHGWLRVKIAELIGLAIADKISAFSYINGKYAYLEEDCDAGVFLRAKFGENITGRELNEQGILKEHYSETTMIRSFDHYCLPLIPA